MLPRLRDGFRYDFAVYDGQGRLAALIEARRRSRTSPDWATHWHTTVVESIGRPAEVSVVLVALDKMYGWGPGADRGAAPDWMIDAAPWLNPYFKRLDIAPGEIAPHVFEGLVGLWLRDAVQSERPETNGASEAAKLLDALRGGEVVQQVAA